MRLYLLIFAAFIVLLSAGPNNTSGEPITDAEYEEALERTMNFYYNIDEPTPFVHRSEKITEDLLHRLVDLGWYKSGAAAVMLAEREDPRGIYVMLGQSHRSRDETYPIGSWAMWSLGSAGCKEGVPILLDVLENENDPEIVEALCDALIGSGERSRDIVDALIKKFKEIKDTEILRDIGHLKTKDALSFLIECLDTEEQDTLYTAISAIAEIGSKEAINVLIKILHEQDENKRKAVAWSLRGIDFRGFEKELTPFLDDSHSYVRTPIAFALAKLGNEKAISLTINAFENNENLDGELELLGEIGDKRAIPILLKKINHENSYFAQDAVIALGKLNAKEALPKLLEIVDVMDLRNEDIDYEEKMLSIYSARACIRMGDDNVIPKIIRNLETIPREWFINAYAMVTIKKLVENKIYGCTYPNFHSQEIDAALLLLIDSKNKQATDYLESKSVKVSLLSPKSIEVNKALKEIGASFESSSPTVRALAAKQAGVLGRAELVDGLEKLLDDEYYNVRDCAALSLGALKSEKSIPKLRAVKQDKMTRAAVEKALKMISSPEEISQ